LGPNRSVNDGAGSRDYDLNCTSDPAPGDQPAPGVPPTPMSKSVRRAGSPRYGHAMSVNDSREVVIEATPEEILDAIADVESAPSWSPQYQSAEVVDTYDDGRPRRVKIKIKAAGLTDEQIVEYSWGDNTAGWTLIKAGQLKSQDAKYTLTPQGDKTKVHFEITVDTSVPLPGFILKRAIKGGTESATDGLRKHVLKVKKGG
jgi:ribosome-associated toxin RatA of RatAB toxin-antitoxin module